MQSHSRLSLSYTAKCGHQRMIEADAMTPLLTLQAAIKNARKQLCEACRKSARSYDGGDDEDDEQWVTAW